LFTRRIHSVLVLVAIILSFAGCSGDDGVVEVSETASPVQFTSPLSPITSPAPKQQVTPTPTVSEPEGGKGTVVGVLYDQVDAEFFAHQLIYLARVREMQPQQGEGEPMLFAELNVGSDPSAQTDENGRFVIENVEPGRYALVARLPNLQESALYKAGTNFNVSVEVEPGKITDMGTVDIAGPW
jgi:hypothetical protein